MKKAKMWLWVSSKGCTEPAYRIMTASKRVQLPCIDSKWSTRFRSCWKRNTFKTSFSRCKAADFWKCGLFKTLITLFHPFRLSNAWSKCSTCCPFRKSNLSLAKSLELWPTSLLLVTTNSSQLLSFPAQRSFFKSGRPSFTSSHMNTIKMEPTKSNRETWDADLKYWETWTSRPPAQSQAMRMTW